MIKSRTGSRACKSIRYVGIDYYRRLVPIYCGENGSFLFVGATLRMRVRIARGTSPINISRVCALIAPPPEKSWQRGSTPSVGTVLTRENSIGGEKEDAVENFVSNDRETMNPCVEIFLFDRSKKFRLLLLLPALAFIIKGGKIYFLEYALKIIRQIIFSRFFSERKGSCVVVSTMLQDK